MCRFGGSCWFVFNKALAMQKANHNAGGKVKVIGYVAMAKALTGWRNGSEAPRLKDVPAHLLQHTLKDLERAYKNLFAKRAASSKWKERAARQLSLRGSSANQVRSTPQPHFLPKLGWLRYRNSRDVLGG